MCHFRCAQHIHDTPLADQRVGVQTTGIALAFAGIFLGHAHGGRQFPTSAHEKLGNIIVIPLLAQLVLGIYLKLHIHERTLRPYVVVVHGIIGKSYPIWGWVQMLFGAIIFLGYCQGISSA